MDSNMNSEMKQELLDRGILLTEEEKNYTREEIQEKVFQVLLVEGDGELGKRLYDFAEMVDYDISALRPLLAKNPQFLSDMENLTHLEFYNIRAQTLYFKKQNRLLKEIIYTLHKVPKVPAFADENFKEVSKNEEKFKQFEEENVKSADEGSEEKDNSFLDSLT